MGSLSEIAYEYRNSGFQLYGLVADVRTGSDTGVEEAKALFSSAGGTFTNMVLSDTVARNLLAGVNVVPAAKFYDSDGVLLTTIKGAMSKQEWINLIETVMYEKA